MARDALPFTAELLARVTDAIAACRRDHGNHIQTDKLVAALLADNIALVDLAKQRAWIDERVHSGVLFRLRAAELRASASAHLDVKAETWRGLPA